MGATTSSAVYTRVLIAVHTEQLMFNGGSGTPFSLVLLFQPFIYGVLAPRVTFKTLIWLGTLLAIPQFAPLLIVNSFEQGLIYAAPIGLMGGIATAAYLDLIIRSCPRGLQGTMIMMSGGIYFLATRVGDVVGTYLYDRFDSFKILRCDDDIDLFINSACTHGRPKKRPQRQRPINDCAGRPRPHYSRCFPTTLSNSTSGDSPPVKMTSPI